MSQILCKWQKERPLSQEAKYIKREGLTINLVLMIWCTYSMFNITWLKQDRDVAKGAGSSDEPGQTGEKLSANDTSWCLRLLKTGPHTK